MRYTALNLRHLKLSILKEENEIKEIDSWMSKINQASKNKDKKDVDYHATLPFEILYPGGKYSKNTSIIHCCLKVPISDTLPDVHMESFINLIIIDMIIIFIRTKN